MKKLNIAVLMGGVSTERDISLNSANQVIKFLDKSKYNILKFDPKDDLKKIIEQRDNIDVVFPVLHGYGGEDGRIQGFLDLLNLKYVGSGAISSAMAMDKKISKIIYRNNGIKVARDIVISGIEAIDKIELPCVVKPSCQGSSVGTNIVFKKDKLESAILEAKKYEDKILVEEYIKGTEITVPVLGNLNPEALKVIEIVPPRGKFFDKEVKYNGQTQEIIPARISSELTKKAQRIAVKSHLALGCMGLSRTDMIISHKDNSIYVLETNTLPGMTSESLFPKSAKESGIGFSDLLDRLIKLAQDK